MSRAFDPRKMLLRCSPKPSNVNLQMLSEVASNHTNAHFSEWHAVPTSDLSPLPMSVTLTSTTSSTTNLTSDNGLSKNNLFNTELIPISLPASQYSYWEWSTNHVLQFHYVFQLLSATKCAWQYLATLTFDPAFPP
ncbi:hypothetical protein GYMLUDRAFT_244135 [Collybiopsis luxurians FD-317 M1]|uniref:Uncharacterized protein n=1 Tax=Collybiopsis luxurians FD-317 M1 TaxID=944289 RepID=A0A0D0BXX1_9AGAR|nr:hypothetical protein GYMLUDRAFT_244135 [Collybiopsis luxurians FD-317 M1]